MSDTARDYQTFRPSSTNGWDDFFSSESGTLQSCPGIESGPDNLCPDSWLTLTQAATHFSVNEKTLRRWIKQGRVRASKIAGPRGEEWRIEPGQPRASRASFVPGHKRESLDILPVLPVKESLRESMTPLNLEPQSELIEVFEDMPGLDIECRGMSSPDILREPSLSASIKQQELIELSARLSIFEKENQELKEQLQGATYRNGYLESKLEERDKQILMLTDSQHKGGWWAKFSSWFFKGK